MPRYKTTEEVLRLSKSLENIRNISICAHVDHGKTTLSDSLLAASGLLSPTVAGEALALDYLKIEQERQFTYKAANVSLFHEFDGKSYIVNLIDTPGHIDFTGNVTRSLRAIDGAVIVVDSVEGVLVQTETVTRQALEEYVRPVLFINKVDRLIRELKLSPQEVEKTLLRIIADFNRLIELYGPEEFRSEWRVDALKGMVAFGSAKDRWGFTIPMMQKAGLKFSDIVSAYQRGGQAELSKVLPLHEAVLNMVVRFHPPPSVAQAYRIPRIWKGDLDSEVGRAMLKCDPNGPIVMAASHIRVDPQAGVVATGRLFSGTVYEGQEVYLVNSRSKGRVQQVCIYMGPHREVVGAMSAGNIPALLGLEAARAGETITTVSDLVPFESIRYVSEPVMTIAVEPRNPAQLPELIGAMHKLSIEDPNLKVTINEQTGEYLLSGMGQLHLEVATTFIQEAGIQIVTSRPIVIYRESIRRKGGPVMVRSPNGHNKIMIEVEPLEPKVIELVATGKIGEFTDRREVARMLRECGWPADEARGVEAVSESFSLLVDATKGVQRLEQVSGSIRMGFIEAMNEGILAREPVRGVKVKLLDATIHEDPAHHGPAQIIPAVRRATHASILLADPVILEPILRLDVRTSMDQVGNVTRVISRARGKVLNIEQKGLMTYIVGELPAAESFDLSEVLRSATGGRVFWDTSFARWEPVPSQLMGNVIAEIRKRKGLPAEVPKVDDLIE
ncbi:MAG: elongation factor EF-2 [Thermoproteota archaeon]